MRDLNYYLKIAITMCEAIGAIPEGKITDATYLKSNAVVWGKCFRRRSDKTFYIKISKKLGDESITPSDDGILNTMIHEVLHACAWNDNHSGMWLKYAEEIDKMFHIDIKRCSSSEEKGMTDEAIAEEKEKRNNSKYIVECTQCGHQYKKSRVCNLVRCPNLYLCGHCNGKLKLVRGEVNRPKFYL